MTARAEGESTGGRPVGLRIIVLYKALKAIVQAGVAVGLCVAIWGGLATDLAGLARAAADRTVHPLLSRAALELAALATPRHLHVLAALLGADALVSAVEGWVLHRGYAWAPWLVVGATGALLPFELVELVHRPRAGVAVMLLANVAIVAYLVRHALAWTPARARAV
jgi:uncharacterized membrane protein (DUF2068 family)